MLFFLRAYNILPKRELHRRVWVGLKVWGVWSFKGLGFGGLGFGGLGFKGFGLSV